MNILVKEKDLYFHCAKAQYVTQYGPRAMPPLSPPHSPPKNQKKNKKIVKKSKNIPILLCALAQAEPELAGDLPCTIQWCALSPWRETLGAGCETSVIIPQALYCIISYYYYYYYYYTLRNIMINDYYYYYYYYYYDYYYIMIKYNYDSIMYLLKLLISIWWL